MPIGPSKATTHKRWSKRGAVAGCKLYKSPVPNSTFNSTDAVTFSWEPSCFSPVPQYVNIMLLSSQGEVFRWEDVETSLGTYQANLDPKWWGNTAKMQLQLGITASDDLLFLSPFPAGPAFTVFNVNTPTLTSASGSNTAAATTTPFVSGGTVNVQRLKSQGGLTRGRLAAAILMPILVAIAAIAAYVYFSRKREARRRAEWTEAVDKRMSTISSDWQSLSAGANTRLSMSTNRERARNSRSMSMLGRQSMTAEQALNRVDGDHREQFASEDVSQLGPRGRALSAAAAEGRPLSSVINQDIPLPPVPVARPRSKSITNDVNMAEVRPWFGRSQTAPHTRTISTSSNNPYAPAMAQRDSMAASDMDEKAVPFPSASSMPPPRLDSNGKPIDSAARARVVSKVSFADAPRPSTDRRRNGGDGDRVVIRGTAREHSMAYDMDFGDALPALALMRLDSHEGKDKGIAFPTGEDSLTPTKEFIPAPKKTEYFDGMPNSGLGGRTPDEMLKAYAAAMATNEKGGESSQESGGIGSGVVKSVMKIASFWKK
ncbi:hypothetical protein CPB86DRAFT_813974 [Serendipita vermifera]|nr:hypothetical protein CPB86DRAFT_813974 [Serendipita vermifera]